MAGAVLSILLSLSLFYSLYFYAGILLLSYISQVYIT